MAPLKIAAEALLARDAAEARLGRLRPLVRAAFDYAEFRDYAASRLERVAGAADPSDRQWALDGEEAK